MTTSFLSYIGDLFSVLAFLIGGYAIGRFISESYRGALWQVQVALVVGFFLVIIGVVDFAPSGLAAGFVLGIGLALLIKALPKEEKKTED